MGIAREDYSHITIDKIVDKTVAAVGDDLTYTVTAVNDGGRDLSDIVLRDTLPEGVSFVSASDGGAHADGVVTWTLSRMPLGQVFSFTVVVRVTEEDTTVVNRWGVDGETPVTPNNPCVEPNALDESCATTTVPDVPLTYAKTSDPVAGSAVKPGDVVTYTVTAQNPSAAVSTAGRLTDDMSEVLDMATLVTAPVLTCAPTTSTCGTMTYSEEGERIAWTSSSEAPLGAETTATITYAVRVNDDATGTLRNVLIEPDIVVEHPIIRVAKVSSAGDGALVEPGDRVGYTLTIANESDVDAASFSVFDDLTDVVSRAVLDADSITIDPAVGEAVYDSDARRLTWTGSLAAGQIITVEYSVRVNDDAFGELRNVFVDKTVVNPIAAALEWTKIDASPDGALLAGSEWTVQALDDDGAPAGSAIVVVDCVAEPCTGADVDATPGVLRVNALTPGEHLLTETRAPIGFVLDRTEHRVTVLGTTAVTVLAGIVNHQQGVPSLPFTGGLGADELLVLGCLLALTTVVLVAWHQRRRRV